MCYFFTGMDRILPFGLPKQIDVDFDEGVTMPIVSTELNVVEDTGIFNITYTDIKGAQKFHHPLFNPFSKCFASE